MNRSTIWICVNITLVLCSVPAAFFLGYIAYPAADLLFIVRIKVHIISILVTLPPFFIWYLLSFRKPLLSAALALLGVLFRLTALAVIFFWMRFYHPGFLRQSLVIYLISIGSFLLFEVVILAGGKFYARKVNQNVIPQNES